MKNKNLPRRFKILNISTTIFVYMYVYVCMLSIVCKSNVSYLLTKRKKKEERKLMVGFQALSLSHLITSCTLEGGDDNILVVYLFFQVLVSKGRLRLDI